MLKKILLALIFVITAITNVTHAEDDMKTVASKAYVDTQIETKQLKIPAANTPGVGAGETVMTYTATGNGQIGERGVFTGGEYDSSNDADKLITASALRDTFTNLPTTGTTKLECANQADGCSLWTIIDQTAYGNMNQLPAGYTQLEYIESTGTQYIDTGYKPTSTSILDLTITNFQTMQTSGKLVFGCGEGEWGISKGWVCGIAGSSGSSAWNCRLSSSMITYSALGITTGNAYTLRYGPDAAIVNGVKKIDFNHSPAIPQSYDRSFWLFRANTNNSSYNNGSWRFGLTTLYDNGNLVRNFIPAENSSGVVGMYDLVSGQFFTNAASTGPDFTAGPPVAN